MDPNLLQLSVRHNAEDLQDYLRDLNNWEEEIKHKDQLLSKQKPILKKRLPPIRSKKNKAGKRKEKVLQPFEERSGKPQQSRISSYDYSSWDKFDVDAACEAVDDKVSKSSEEDSDGSEDEEMQEGRNKQIAMLEKERGNKLFKEGKHEAAVERYSRAMELDSTNSVLPANRAMALLKLERFAAAEEDCSLSLSLDQTYLKAWLRRATAREKLGKLAEAKQDFEQVLKMEPGNKLAKSELSNIQQKLTARSRKKVPGPITPPTGPYIYPVVRPPHLRSQKPMKRIAIEEIGGIGEFQSAQVPLQTTTNRTAVSDHLLPVSGTLDKEKRNPCASKGPLVEVDTKPGGDGPQAGSLVIQCKAKHTSPPLANAPATGKGDTDSSHMAVPEPATNSILFQSHWKSLKKERTLLVEYFQSISPSSYPVLLQQSLETSTFSDILSILEEHYVRAGKTCLEEMKWLVKVQRFQVAIMFLNRAEKQVVKNIFSGLNELLSSADEKQELSSLAKIYSVAMEIDTV